MKWQWLYRLSEGEIGWRWIKWINIGWMEVDDRGGNWWRWMKWMTVNKIIERLLRWMKMDDRRWNRWNWMTMKQGGWQWIKWMQLKKSKEVKRSDSLWRFACGNVLLCRNLYSTGSNILFVPMISHCFTCMSQFPWHSLADKVFYISISNTSWNYCFCL